MNTEQRKFKKIIHRRKLKEARRRGGMESSFRRKQKQKTKQRKEARKAWKNQKNQEQPNKTAAYISFAKIWQTLLTMRDWICGRHLNRKSKLNGQRKP